MISKKKPAEWRAPLPRGPIATSATSRCRSTPTTTSCSRHSTPPPPSATSSRSLRKNSACLIHLQTFLWQCIRQAEFYSCLGSVAGSPARGPMQGIQHMRIWWYLRTSIKFPACIPIDLQLKKQHKGDMALKYCAIRNETLNSVLWVCRRWRRWRRWCGRQRSTSGDAPSCSAFRPRPLTLSTPWSPPKPATCGPRLSRWQSLHLRP